MKTINIKAECAAMRKRTRELQKLSRTNPELAQKISREFLIRAGIYTKTGRLKKVYGG